MTLQGYDDYPLRTDLSNVGLPEVVTCCTRAIIWEPGRAAWFGGVNGCTSAELVVVR